MLNRLLTIAALVALPVTVRAADLPIRVIAAENFYGEVAEQIGGDRVKVENVLMNPNTDPHEYEPTASVARDVADAGVVIMNGADYDPWMQKLTEASSAPDRVVIDVAALIGRKPGDNPHLWYDPAAMPALGDALVAALSKIDPDGAAGYGKGRDEYLAALKPIGDRIAALRQRYAGTPVTATEPVFGLMAKALGFEMRNEAFQTAVMNDAEPSASSIAAFEDDLKQHKVKVLFYNNQVTDPLTDRLLGVAKTAGVPVIGVTETLPPGMNFVEWMTSELDATGKALAGTSS